jgi:hypothetical protein
MNESQALFFKNKFTELRKREKIQERTVCMYISMYVCMYVGMYVNINVSISICLYARKYFYMYVVVITNV